MAMTVEQRIRAFVQETFFVEDPAALTNDTSLIVEGIVDSTGMLEIIGFLEAEYGIRISDAETVPENLETIGRMVAFVATKLRVAAGA
jgi:acyl carrier protein